MSTRARELAEGFVRTFNERAGADDLYAPDATVWNNLTGAEQPHAAVSAITSAMQAALPDLRFDDVTVHAWDDGFAIQYTLAATAPDGTEIRVLACGIGAVRAGRIRRFQEYVDSAQAAPLGAALAAAAR